MLDRQARRYLQRPLDAIAAPLAAAGVSPGALTAVGFLAGAGACVAVGFGQYPVALVLWLLNRLLDGLDGPVARQRGSTELGGFLDIVADFTVYAGFVLGLAIDQPGARVACIALLCAYYVSGTAFLALSSLLEKRGTDLAADARSLRFVGGVAEGTETVVVYVLFCLFPGATEVIAWVFTAAVGITALQRVILGRRVLRHRTEVRA